MRKFEFEEGDISLSSDFTKTEDDEYWARHEFDQILESVFANNEVYKKYIDIYGKVHRLRRYSVLEAHGSTDDKGRWVYSDSGRNLLVQSWVNENDGKYAGLIIQSCNPDTLLIKSRKSLVVIPDRITSRLRMDSGEVSYDVIAPFLGAIDSYLIDSEIKALEARLAAQKL